jgi:hypothetical protein
MALGHGGAGEAEAILSAAAFPGHAFAIARGPLRQLWNDTVPKIETVLSQASASAHIQILRS